MTHPHGYFFCDRCEELASGARCEHCSAVAPVVRWVRVPLHHNLFRQRAGGPKPVSAEKAARFFLQIHQAADRAAGK